MENILSVSSSMKSEYCCSVVRIGELTPIEGSDFLAKTNVLGTQIIVRKDQVKEGDVMFYASNETALNEKFLSVNNLFEIGCRDMNSNADEVNAIMQEYLDNHKSKSEELKLKAKNVKYKMNSFTFNSARYQKQVSKLKASLDSTDDESKRGELQAKIDELQSNIDDATKKVLEQTVVYSNLKMEIEKIVKSGQHIVDEAKKKVGFFNKYGRVRCITLKGEPSFGFVFGKKEMENYCPEVSQLNLEELVGQDFDTVNRELFVKAFVPPVKQENRRSNKSEKRNKKLKRFDRLVEGEFKFHYDTNQLQREISRINPEDTVTLTVKLHGTSICIAKAHVKEPKKIALYKRLWNKVVDATGLFKSTRFIDYDIVYGPVYSSRTVIKNQYINKEVGIGFYGNVDLWSRWGERIYPYLTDGMTVYGEIVGYVHDSDKMIQKHYDYGCKEGENRLMIYRISLLNDNGTRFECNVEDVYDWTIALIDRMKQANDENYKLIHPIDILYHGTLKDLYPELNTENHWHEEVLERLKKDKEHLGMEEYEPLCNNSVPREGFVLRIDDDPVTEAWKLKTTAFSLKEACMMDAGEVDIEMLDNYVNDGEEGNDGTTATE